MIWMTSTILLYGTYIGTDASLMELHTELLINTTLKPSDAFVFKYRTQDTSTAEEKLLQKDQPFIWDNAAQQAFDEMKKHFT